MCGISLSVLPTMMIFVKFDRLSEPMSNSRSYHTDTSKIHVLYMACKRSGVSKHQDLVPLRRTTRRYTLAVVRKVVSCFLDVYYAYIPHAWRPGADPKYCEGPSQSPDRRGGGRKLKRSISGKLPKGLTTINSSVMCDGVMRIPYTTKMLEDGVFGSPSIHPA